ncbi:MAG: TatD family hydrolase [Clostridiales bacterium]|nr:TatD family hydrolase [Clostridiales bacterium]
MRLFDSHCHLDDEKFDDDRDQLIKSLPAQDLAYCLTVGSDLASSRHSLDLAQKYSFIFAGAGVHPHEAAKASADYLEELEILLDQNKVVALGEIGLDYYYDFSPRDLQRKLLEEQLDLAYQKKLPVILHVREAHGDMIDILRMRVGSLPQGVLHCFSGSAQSALEYVKLGFHISFAGPITFKNAGKLLLAAQAVPLERLLIETDSPYLAPVPDRGKRNDPSKVKYVCQKLASLRSMETEKIAEITFTNAINLFKITAS